ncbi:hypothetical protein D3C77_677520 [compost metagenome]
MDHRQIADMASSGAAFEEVPLGEGSVDFPAYFAALQSIAYTGYLTIEREVGPNPTQDIQQAVHFIRSFR